jgi:hypothetical protein
MLENGGYRLSWSAVSHGSNFSFLQFLLHVDRDRLNVKDHRLWMLKDHSLPKTLHIHQL